MCSFPNTFRQKALVFLRSFSFNDENLIEIFIDHCEINYKCCWWTFSVYLFFRKFHFQQKRRFFSYYYVNCMYLINLKNLAEAVDLMKMVWTSWLFINGLQWNIKRTVIIARNWSADDSLTLTVQIQMYASKINCFNSGPVIRAFMHDIIQSYTPIFKE